MKNAKSTNIVTWGLSVFLSMGCSPDLGIYFVTIGEEPTTEGTASDAETSSGSGSTMSSSGGESSDPSSSGDFTSGMMSTTDSVSSETGAEQMCEECGCCDCDVDCILEYCQEPSCKAIADAQVSGCELELFKNEETEEFNEYTLYRGTKVIQNVYCDDEWTYKLVTGVAFLDCLSGNCPTTNEAMDECKEFNMKLFYPTSFLHLKSAIGIAKLQEGFNTASGEFHISHLRIMAIFRKGNGSCEGVPFKSGEEGCSAWGPPGETEWFVRWDGLQFQPSPHGGNQMMFSVVDVDTNEVYYTNLGLVPQSSRYICTVYPSEGG